jgi:stage V sporulation protein B
MTGKKQGFIKGAVILAVAGVICRLLGVAFRIPLASIVGNYGIGLYQLVFPLYSLLLIISSAGVPVAISKMVARERENRNECKKIFINALIALAIIGFIISALFIIFAKTLAAVQGNNDTGLLYFAIAPSVFFVCIISAFRGYFQGLADMVPTAVSQVAEQAIKVGVGLSLAFVLIKQSVMWAVFGAVLAVSVSEAAAVCILWIIYKCKNKCKNKKIKLKSQIDFSYIKKIFVNAAPITVMAAVFPLLLMFDSFFVVNALKSAGIKNATELYGISSGAVHTLINLPTVVGMALAASIVPMVARFHKQGNKTETKKKTIQAVGLVFVFAVGCAVIMFLFAPLILRLLYAGAFHNKNEEFNVAVGLLKIESLLIILICGQQVITGILQGADKSKFPLIALSVGGAAKIIYEIVFISKIGIAAVSWANVICFVFALLINIIFLIKTVFLRQS